MGLEKENFTISQHKQQAVKKPTNLCSYLASSKKELYRLISCLFALQACNVFTLAKVSSTTEPADEYDT